MIKTLLTFIALLFFSLSGFSQKISLYKQFYGSYDFTMMGNTMNVKANGDETSCEILTESSANLNIANNKNIVAAYLYWSGHGAEKEADLNVKLNGETVVSERVFTNILMMRKMQRIFLLFQM